MLVIEAADRNEALMTFLLRTTKDQITYKNGDVIISDHTGS